MKSLLAFIVASLTACAIALPPAEFEGRGGPQPLGDVNRRSLHDYLLPRYLRSQYVPTQGQSRILRSQRPQLEPPTNWLNEEIDRINQMTEPNPRVVPYKPEFPLWINHEPYNRIMYGSSGTRPERPRGHLPAYIDYTSFPSKADIKASNVPRKYPKPIYYPLPTTTDSQENVMESEGPKKVFALTPSDAGYFEQTEIHSTSNLPDVPEGPHEGGGHQDSEDLNPPRQIRQNPLGRTKTLVAGDLDKLREGLSKHEMRVPVSLLPTNLNWLKITKDIQTNLNESDAEKEKIKHNRVLGSQFATGSIYIVGIAAGIGTAILLAVMGLIFGYYALSNRAKAAADVDYPAYGVTGPTMDTSGDRKLAHSAQMYHYQHQKQQIIAMERNNAEQRNDSVSDPESEEENEEGDYTVYECPGFATTGDMEVKNPLFNEEPTPATPGKIEEVKPESKE